MQISGLGGAAAMWATRPASEVGRPGLAELEQRGQVERGSTAGARMFDRLTSSDREVLFAATGSWIDSEGQLNFEQPKTFEEMQAITHMADAMETDRRTGALVGDISSDYVSKLMERVSSGAENYIDPRVLDRALDFVRSREAGGAPARVPLDVRA